MTKLEKVNQAANRETEAIAGGLIGLAIVTIIELLGLQALDFSLKVTLYSFAVSIPALSFILVTLLAGAHYPYTITPWYGVPSFVIGVFASLIGVASLFFHFSTLAGVVFTVLAIFSFHGSARYSALLIKINKEEAKKTQQEHEIKASKESLRDT